MKTRLCNIFKTKNTRTLIMAITRFKSLQASTNVITNNYPRTAHTFSTHRSVFTLFLRSNCYNIRTPLTRSIKLNFLEFGFWRLTTGQNSHSYSKPIRNNSPLNFFLKLGFFAMFLLKNVKDKTLSFLLAKNMGNYFPCIKILKFRPVELAISFY